MVLAFDDLALDFAPHFDGHAVGGTEVMQNVLEFDGHFIVLRPADATADVRGTVCLEHETTAMTQRTRHG